VEEASPVATICDEPQCLVPAASNNASSVGNRTNEVECCTEMESEPHLSADNEHHILEHNSASSPALRTCDRKRRSTSQGLGTASQRKQKLQ